jgi:hypothetical protein
MDEIQSQLRNHADQTRVALSRMEYLFSGHDKALEDALDQRDKATTSEELKAAWAAIEELHKQELADYDRIAMWMCEAHEKIIGEHLERQG